MILMFFTTMGTGSLRMFPPLSARRVPIIHGTAESSGQIWANWTGEELLPTSLLIALVTKDSKPFGTPLRV